MKLNPKAVEKYKLYDEIISLLELHIKESPISLADIFKIKYNEDLDKVLRLKKNGFDTTLFLDFTNIENSNFSETHYSKYVELTSILKYFNSLGLVTLTYDNSNNIYIALTNIGELKVLHGFVEEYEFEVIKQNLQIKLSENQIYTNKTITFLTFALVLTSLLALYISYKDYKTEKKININLQEIKK